MHSKQRENDGKQKERGGSCGVVLLIIILVIAGIVAYQAGLLPPLVAHFLDPLAKQLEPIGKQLGPVAQQLESFAKSLPVLGADTHAGGSPLSRLWLFGNSPDRHFTALTTQAIRDVV